MIKLVDHLLVQEKLTLIRRKGIDGIHFRGGIIEIGRWLAYELTNTLEKEKVTVQTPLGIADGFKIKDKNDIVVVSVLRAAIPLVEGIMRVFRNAQYGWWVPPAGMNPHFQWISAISNYHQLIIGSWSLPTLCWPLAIQ